VKFRVILSTEYLHWPFSESTFSIVCESESFSFQEDHYRHRRDASLKPKGKAGTSIPDQ